jgi:tRNA G10  N-methylase Trm11
VDNEIFAAIVVTGLTLLGAAGVGFEIARRMLERADENLDVLAALDA